MGMFYGVARVIAGFLGFTSLVGVNWFGGALTSVDFTSGLIIGLTSLAAAVIPARKLSHTSVLRALLTLCVAGSSAGMVLVASGLAPPYPIEWDVVIINLVNAGALVAMAAKART